MHGGTSKRRFPGHPAADGLSHACWTAACPFAVWQATTPDGRAVAVKALSLRAMRDWKQLDLFQREARCDNHNAVYGRRGGRGRSCMLAWDGCSGPLRLSVQPNRLPTRALHPSGPTRASRITHLMDRACSPALHRMHGAASTHAAWNHACQRRRWPWPNPERRACLCFGPPPCPSLQRAGVVVSPRHPSVPRVL